MVSLLFEIAYAPFLEDRHFIMFDQRGVGLSEPALACPEYVEEPNEQMSQHLSMDEIVATATEELGRCRDRLVGEGVNLKAYTSVESAAEVAALRRALEYNRWNLLGVSYGTRLALTVMRDHPEGIRSVVLDSTFPIQVDLYASMPANADRSLSLLFAACRRDPECDAAHPDLEKVFFDLVEQLDDDPVSTTITNPLTGDSYDVLITGGEFVGAMFTSMYASDVIAGVPEVIMEVANGEFGKVRLLTGTFLIADDATSIGMHYSVQCGEEVPFTTEEKVGAGAAAYPWLSADFDNTPIFAMCDAWDVGQPRPIENEPVFSDIPTLILAGEYDPVTPPEWGGMVADDLERSYYYEFPGLGHGVSLSADCPLEITIAFLRTPGLAPDSSCIGELGAPEFAAVGAEITLEPYTSDLGFNTVVPAGWNEISPGTFAAPGIGKASITFLAIPGVSPEQFLAVLASQLGLDDPDGLVADRVTKSFTWGMYELALETETLDMAFVKDGETSYLVMLESFADRDRYYSEVLVPALEAFALAE